MTQQRGAAVVARVLEVTLQLVAETGDDWTVDDVAERAGVHKTTVYRRWETRSALLAAAVESLAQQEVKARRTGDPLDDLRALAADVARALRSARGGNALRAALGGAAGDSERQVAAAAFLAARYALATDIVAAAQQAGALRTDVDPELLWRAVVNPLHLAALLGQPLRDTDARALLDLVVDGARPR